MWFLIALAGIAASVDFEASGDAEGDEDAGFARPEDEDDTAPTSPPPPNEEGAWRDPWLDGDWDDEFISTDTTA